MPDRWTPAPLVAVVLAVAACATPEAELQVEVAEPVEVDQPAGSDVLFTPDPDGARPAPTPPDGAGQGRDGT